MDNVINLKINGKEVTAVKGQTILQVAKENGIDIPNMCYSEKVKVYGACGVCVVEAKGMPKLMRSCATMAAEGMDIETETPRVVQARKVALELMLSDHKGDCRPPCVKACPAGTDCQGYVGLIANGKFDEANKLVKDKFPLPASIGRVCPHPCEQKCRRQAIDDPVQIAFLKRFVGDKALESASSCTPDIAADTGKKVAVIGGGPAGLSAAYHLRRMGHGVTIFDAMPHMGGMLRYGIPEYRLPNTVVDAEVKAIENMGVKLVNNTKINAEKFNELKADYDAVLVAIGAWTSSKMRIPGEDAKGVMGGIDFLRKLALKEESGIGKRVAVVGGGNTAMDACRSAVRAGAEEVYTFYRRTREEMPADKVEVNEAEEEGVIFKFLCNPVEILSKDGVVCGIKAQKMELGEPDASGRRSPVPVEGAFEIVELDTVIMAIGQGTKAEGFEELELTRKGTIVADEKSYMTSVEGVFACGDATNKGADIAIRAIGEAINAAASINEYLGGKKRTFAETSQYDLYSSVEPTFEQIREKHSDKAPVQKIVMSHDNAEERKTNFNEFMHGFTEDEAIREASKCLECGCMDYYECKLINYANRYDCQPGRLAGSIHKAGIEDCNEFIIRDTAKCVLCGLCVRACEEVTGNTALGLVGRGFDTIVAPEMCLALDKSKCTACGLCVSLCPTGALTEKPAMKKAVPLKQTREESVCRFCTNGCKTEVVKHGTALLKVEPAEGVVNLCHNGRFGVCDDDFAYIECGSDYEAAVNAIVEDIKATVNLDLSKPAVAISALHTEAEAKALMAACKKALGDVPVFTLSGGKKLSGKDLELSNEANKQNGKDTVSDIYFGVSADGLAKAGVSSDMNVAKNSTVILAFGEDIDEKTLGISVVKLPNVFEKL